MDVLVTGSSGLIGAALAPVLEAAGHRVIRLRRTAATAPDLGWDPDAATIDGVGLEGIDAVVHLAGEGIAEKRWTPEQKARILESRTRGTDLLACTLAGLTHKPRVLVSASAIGYYGNRGDERLTEQSESGSGFLAEVCRAWEEATAPAAAAGIRVAFARTGIVLSPKGGALAQMLTPFKLGLGGRLGSGHQYMSWITLVDEVRALVQLVEDERLAGPVNLTAPNPVTNRELTKALGHALHRPTVLPTPLFPLRKRYGRELVQELLLDGQRVLPDALTGVGFEFLSPQLGVALDAILRDG
ncbi:MAG TPA: TIGR01777 family oxidoreductase [Acidimicrobiia bacterium]|nr:TIGR01777 family oxidoreductase [Acidimicrobiia bacterium]